MSIQDIITRIANDPRLGGFKDTNGACAYRTVDGHACALGCLFTDEQLERFCGGDFSYDPETLDVFANIEELYEEDDTILDDFGLNFDQAEILQEFHDSFNDQELDIHVRRANVQAAFKAVAAGKTVPFGKGPFHLSIERLERCE